MEENRVNDQKLENVKKINIQEDFKIMSSDSEIEVPIKDAFGYWTDKQIEENPEAYLEYLENQLNNATLSQDLEKIKKLIMEISKINKKYFDIDYNNVRGKVK